MNDLNKLNHPGIILKMFAQNHTHFPTIAFLLTHFSLFEFP